MSHGPAGSLEVPAEVVFEGENLVLRGLHVYGLDMSANAMGVGAPRRIVRDVVDEREIDAVFIEGAR